MLALPGTILFACSGLGGGFSVRYGGLEVVQDARQQGGGVQVRVAGRSGGKRPSAAAVRSLLLLARILVWGFALVSLPLLLVGAGQTLYRGWGRRLAVVWGALASLFAFVAFVVLLPEYSATAVAICDEVIGGRAAAQACPSMSFGASMIYLVVALVYPLLNVLYFASDSAREAMG